MNHLEQQLHYPLGETVPAPGEALEVAPGIRWARMGLPFALDHVNLFLLRDTFEGREGWTVVDCCIDAPASREQWERIIATGLDGLPVVRVLVTHMHPDHIGLAHWLCARFDAPLWISATDYYAARAAMQNAAGSGGHPAADFFASHGLRDEAALAKIRQRTRYYLDMVPAVPPAYRRLMDGRAVRIGGRDWRCIAGYGHAPEHIALYSADFPEDVHGGAGVLLGGDMALPRISTNVSVFDVEPESDALTLFLQSIDRFLELPEGCYTLPAHGKPFTGLHIRVGQLHDHHRDRLAEVLSACAAGPRSAADILPVLFRRALDAHQTTFAMGEALAHLHALWHGGQLRRARDEDGIWRFRLAGG